MKRIYKIYYLLIFFALASFYLIPASAEQALSVTKSPGNSYRISSNGDLVFDPRYEIEPGSSEVGQSGGGDDRIAVVDTAINAAYFVEKLRSSGVVVVGRYYARKRQRYLPQKRIAFNYISGKSEANILLDEGFSILSIYQYKNNRRSKFVSGLSDTGSTVLEARADATAALDQAQLIGQHPGSAIYFGVDFDLQKNDSIAINAVKEYFIEVGRVFAGKYKIGVYGNGVANEILKDAGLTDYHWVSASVAYSETNYFYNSGNWHLFQNQVDRYRYEADNRCPSGISLDTDIQNPKFTDFGFWGAGEVSNLRVKNIFDARRFAKVSTSVYNKPSTSSGRISKTRCRYLRGQGFKRVYDYTVRRVRNAAISIYNNTWFKVDIDDDGVFDGFSRRNGFVSDMSTMPKW